eukprot:g4875.t1
MEGSTTTRAVDTRQYISDTFSDKPVHVSYNRRDLIVYAIGIGSKDLRYVYEDHEDFAAFPTYPIVLSFKAPLALDGNPEFGDVPRVPAGVPVFPKQEMMNLSPEQLVRASLPWQGMDTPWRQPGGPGAVGNAWRLSKFARMNYARREPWDMDRDTDQNAPFDNEIEAPVPSHAPPYYAGDGEQSANQKMNDPTWERVVLAPPLIPNGPAQYGHGYKPAGYYRHPFKRLGTSQNSPLQVALELGERVVSAGDNSAGIRRSVGEDAQAYRKTNRGRRLRGRERDSSASFLAIETKFRSDPPNIDGIADARPSEIVGIPPQYLSSNPKMTTNTEHLPKPIIGPLDPLYFDSQDAKQVERTAPAPTLGTDLTIPPMSLAYTKFKDTETDNLRKQQQNIFRVLDSMPRPDSSAARRGLYPPEPPEPLFGV